MRVTERRVEGGQGIHLKGMGSPILPPNTVTVPAPRVFNKAPTAAERDEVVAEVVAEVVFEVEPEGMAGGDKGMKKFASSFITLLV